ncbi:hypothetical protein BT93_G0287 [Corymbia citriodora subsp. variegata]|nr:hypothetical protein BT93_G0287 [Corymbia citriodora subsp. variegata]
MPRRRRHHRRGRRRRTEDEGAEQQEVAPATPPSRPHFFKIILSHTLESGKLGIPQSFLRRYGKDLSGLVLLKVADGLTWPVKLEKGGDDVVWLWKGWRKFMDHYSIGHGHLLVFKYEGDSVFRMIIFDKSASEINYPSSIESYGASPEGECLSRKEENVVEIEDSEGFAPCSWPSSNGSSREFGGRIEIEQSQHRESSSAPAFHFSPCLSPRIPCEFFRKHLQKNKQKEVATLRHLGSSWQVKLWSSDHRGMACLSIGWPSFARETGLRVRDVCIFELIDRDDVVFRVSIFTSDGQIEIEQSQCQESSSEPAFDGSPHPHSVTVREKVSKFESEYPFFHVILPNHISRNLNIPWEFMKTYVPADRRTATLVNSGRSWEVKLYGYERSHTAILSAGWSAFAREACLRKGDACVFELVDRDGIVFRVSILICVNKKVICIA